MNEILFAAAAVGVVTASSVYAVARARAGRRKDWLDRCEEQRARSLRESQR